MEGRIDIFNFRAAKMFENFQNIFSNIFEITEPASCDSHNIQKESTVHLVLRLRGGTMQIFVNMHGTAESMRLGMRVIQTKRTTRPCNHSQATWFEIPSYRNTSGPTPKM